MKSHNGHVFHLAAASVRLNSVRKCVDVDGLSNYINDDGAANGSARAYLRWLNAFCKNSIAIVFFRDLFFREATNFLIHFNDIANGDDPKYTSISMKWNELRDISMMKNDGYK